MSTGFRAGCREQAGAAMMWLVQAIVWIVVATPVLAYAIVMAVIGGGFTRRANPHATHGLGPPTPNAPHTPGEARSTGWIGRDGGM